MQPTPVIRAVFACLLLATTTAAAPVNRVLDLDGDGDAVRLPGDLLAGLEETTIEAWVRWERFGLYAQPIGLGRSWRGLFVNNKQRSGDLQFFAYLSAGHLELIHVSRILQLGRWHHLGAVITRQGLELYLDGVLVGARRIEGTLVTLGTGGEALLGGTHWEGNEYFAGQIDEVRVWRRARTGDEIRADMHRRLTGSEAGLHALYGFDEGDARDEGPGSFHGQMLGDARTIVEILDERVVEAAPRVAWGSIRDEAGRTLSNVGVDLYCEGDVARRAQSDNQGNYRLSFHGAPCDLEAQHGDLGLWHLGLEVDDGDVRHLDLTLSPAVSFEGRTLRLDGSPQGFVAVQAVGAERGADGRPQTVYSGADGTYRFINLRPGRYRLRSLALDGLREPHRHSDALLAGGPLSKGVDFRSAPTLPGTWRSFDGLTHHPLSCLEPTSDGAILIGSEGGGLFRFDGQTFVQFTAQDGLWSDTIRGLHERSDGEVWIATSRGISRWLDGALTPIETPILKEAEIAAMTASGDGALWVGTLRHGLVRCDVETPDVRCAAVSGVDEVAAQTIHTLSISEDGAVLLGTNKGLLRYDGHHLEVMASYERVRSVHALLPEEDGTVVLGTELGLIRHDGSRFEPMANEDGLREAAVFALLRDRSGRLWVGSDGGLTCIVGRLDRDRGQPLRMASVTSTVSLAQAGISDIAQSEDGALWFAGATGLSRLDVSTYRHLTTAGGLPSNAVNALHVDPDASLWIGTMGGLVHRTEERLVRYTTAHGLPDNRVYAIHRGPDGQLWLGFDAAIARFDGVTFTGYTARHGVVVQQVEAIAHDRRGRLWFTARLFGLYLWDGQAVGRWTRPLPGYHGQALYVDDEDRVWIGTDRGLVRTDGRDAHEVEGTASHGAIHAIHREPEGDYWLGSDNGLLHYDGNSLRRYGAEDGLAKGAVYALHRTATGLLALGTTGGISLFDGSEFGNLDRRDGLGNGPVRAIETAPGGDLWLGTSSGLVRYDRATSRPRVQIHSLRTDRLYNDLNNLPPVATTTRFTVRYSAVDLHTRRGGMTFLRRIVGVGREQDGGGWGRTEETEWDTFLTTPGPYRLEVVAVGSELRRSQPAIIEVSVVSPWYANPWVTGPGGVAIGALLGSSLFYSRRYYLQRRETRRLHGRMLEQERSAREELEGAYEEVQRLLSQEERAAVILRGWAHAVKSPLTIIRRELESTQGPAPADLSERVRAIVDTVDRMLGAAVDLQSRMIELRSELNLLLYRTAQRFAKVEIHASQGEDIHIHADHAKLMMAFENLFLNACQTVDEAGGNVWLEVTRHGERVIVRVRDDGGGIPERIRSRLFEHTVTTRKDRGGTGLGLLITRHVIEAHNGSVTVENTGPTGTAFRVEIPRRWKT